jgi:hypothetical protein
MKVNHKSKTVEEAFEEFRKHFMINDPDKATYQLETFEAGWMLV